MKNQSKKPSKPTKIIAPKSAAKKDSHAHTVNNDSAKEKKSHHKPQNPWGNIFDSAFSDDIKTCMNHFMNNGNLSFCGLGTSTNHGTDINKNIMTKLSQNIRHQFEQNMNLGSEILKCKTAIDFVEFGRKSFEINYKNSIKLYTDLTHDMQNMASQNIKDITNLTNKTNQNSSIYTNAHS